MNENCDVIVKLVQQTWKDRLTGAGADAIGLTHSGLNIQKISAVRNLKLLQQYQTTFRDLLKRHSLPKKLETIKTEKVLRGDKNGIRLVDFSLSDDFTAPFFNVWSLRPGETLLFHGTTRKGAKGIAASGFDLTRSQRGLYGHPSIYLAESSQKSDQYAVARKKRSRQDATLCLLVVRVALGKTEMFEAQKEGESYGTIVGGTDKRFREFIVKNPEHLYPQFLVEYTRNYTILYPV